MRHGEITLKLVWEKREAATLPGRECAGGIPGVMAARREEGGDQRLGVDAYTELVQLSHVVCHKAQSSIR